MLIFILFCEINYIYHMDRSTENLDTFVDNYVLKMWDFGGQWSASKIWGRHRKGTAAKSAFTK